MGASLLAVAKSIYSWLKPCISFTLNFVITFSPFSINAHIQVFHTDLLTFSFIQWCECYAHCDWSLPMIYQSTDTWLTSQQTYFLCFVQHGAWFWKCLWDSFGLKHAKASDISDTLACGSCATFLWSITEQTHGKMGSICLTELVERTLLSLLFLVIFSLDCVWILLHCYEKIDVGHS